VRHQLDVLLQVVDRDGQVLSAFAKLEAGVTWKGEVQAQVLDGTAVERLKKVGDASKKGFFFVSTATHQVVYERLLFGGTNL